MAGQLFIQHNGSGGTKDVRATQIGGTPNANKIVALDANGRVAQSMMPEGILPDNQTIVASEALAARDLVNIWDDNGTAKIRKADATTFGKEAHAFVDEDVAEAAQGVVYFEGNINGYPGVTIGPVYLSTVAGNIALVPPSGAGQVIQRVGLASGSSVNFEPGKTHTLAAE